ncbi:D-arabitol-phosphate dehydrogenase [subsurface metagenome]
MRGYKDNNMKALVLTEYNRFEYQDVPKPEMGPDDVLIKVKACGICGSDIHGMDGSTGRRQPPLIMGHEASGVVADTGAQVADWRIGERVTFDSTIYCGACPHCIRGEVNLCDHRRVLGVSCDEYLMNGAFADYVVVPQHILYRLPDNLHFVPAVMVETCSIAFHAVRRTPMTLNDMAVVVGTGMVGLLIVQAAKQAGCGTVIAVDLDQDRLNLARELGADATLRSDETDVVEAVANLTDGRGADIAFEVVGIETTVNLAIASLRKGGALTLVGNLAPAVRVPLQTLVTRELTVYGSCASSGEYPACLEMMAAGRINVDPILSATVPLAEGAAWFKRLYDREPGLLKVVLKP